MATLGPSNTDLGAVQSESHTKNSSLFNQPLPATDSSSSILLDLFGMSRTITIEGIFTDTVANIRTFIGVIEGFAAGTQTGLKFVSSLITSPASYNTFIESFTWNYVKGAPDHINYSLNLIEGASVS